MKVILTGAAGFLGWHARLRLVSTTTHQVIPVSRENWDSLPFLVEEADAVIHVAGVNRGAESEVLEGNHKLATDVAKAIRSSGKAIRVVYANSIKVSDSSPYGNGKRKACEILTQAAAEVGGHFVDVVLPNLFGEHCEPNYNAFTATFIDHVINGTQPNINDSSIGLLHAQDAADCLIQSLESDLHQIIPEPVFTTVSQTWETIQDFHSSYVLKNEIPDLNSKFKIDLFNSFRAALFPVHYPIIMSSHTDNRGTFVETIRSRGGESQSSVSSTAPGITRGEHYHLSKIERFVVIQGMARIELRRMFSDHVFVFEIDGKNPRAIDMPTGWIHNITNIGDQLLLTQFWSHELFRPEKPDTYPAMVRPKEQIS